MQPIRDWLSEHWQIEAHEWIAVGPVWRVSAPGGDLCVKFAKHGIDKLLFHHYAIESLWQNHFQGTPRLIPNAEGSVYTELPEGPLTVSAWVGRPLDETSLSEWQAAAAELARFHRASVGLALPAGVKPIVFGGKWLRRLPQRTLEMEESMRSFHLPRNDFEAAVLRDGEPVLAAAADAVSALQQSAYGQMVRDLAETPVLVHGNVKGENFAVAKGGRVSLIDFDSFRVDLPVQDVANLMTHVFLARRYSLADAQAVFSAYHEVRPFTPQEAGVLVALLSYPYDVQKVIHKYTAEGRSVEKSLRKWERALGEWRTFDDFLKKWASWLHSRVQ